MKLSFSDVLLTPKFSTIASRKDVDTSQNFLGVPLKMPIIAANMDSICGSKMAATLALHGAIGALHRFCTIEENVRMYYDALDAIHNSKVAAPHSAIIGSVGIGDKEFERALALTKAGCKHILIDVAHGAALHVVQQYDKLRQSLSEDVYVLVGNFATASCITDFCKHSTSIRKPDAWKIGIGGGSLCTTRIVTGCGWPTLASIVDCAKLGVTLIADGGIRNSGDIAKALAAGASVVMLGSVLAGTDETPGEVITYPEQTFAGSEEKKLFYERAYSKKYKKYRGSASAESYNVQNKTASHRAPEGESTLVPYKGPVKGVLETLDGGLRSAMSYLNANTLTELRECDMVTITNNGYIESGAHGKN